MLRSVPILLLSVGLALLGGCGSAGMLNGGPSKVSAQPIQPSQTAAKWTMVTLAPIANVPSEVQDQVLRQITKAALDLNVILRVDGAKESE